MDQNKSPACQEKYFLGRSKQVVGGGGFVDNPSSPRVFLFFVFFWHNKNLVDTNQHCQLSSTLIHLSSCWAFVTNDG